MLESHNQIIKGREVVADDWSVLRLDEDEAAESAVVPEGKIIVPLAVWLAQRDALAARADIGVWIGADERPETLKGELDKFAVVAVDFPKFTDGRGYSIAYNLRKRLGYTGELRAIGDVLRDQLFSMHRVGFDAYATRPDRRHPRCAEGPDRCSPKPTRPRSTRTCRCTAAIRAMCASTAATSATASEERA